MNLLPKSHEDHPFPRSTLLSGRVNPGRGGRVMRCRGSEEGRGREGKDRFSVIVS